jgi:hypothetical protein
MRGPASCSSRRRVPRATENITNANERAYISTHQADLIELTVAPVLHVRKSHSRAAYCFPAAHIGRLRIYWTGTAASRSSASGEQMPWATRVLTTVRTHHWQLRWSAIGWNRGHISTQYRAETNARLLRARTWPSVGDGGGTEVIAVSSRESGLGAASSS